MPLPAADQKIYHIVNVDKLPSIITEGRIYCDAEMAKKSALGGTTIGMNAIKNRRFSLPVSCYSDARVSDFTPFYYCPRSVMLYVIHCANNPELTYRGGQDPIVHLEADLGKVIDWADERGHSWTIAGSNAGAAYTKFWRSKADLGNLNWAHIAARQWAASEIKEAKQAEFLFYHHFPWHLVERIGVNTLATFHAATAAVKNATHKPAVQQMPAWYY
ncbi:hypothetical protein GCM10007881_20230 [Mesorhizobium huakuii]|nr:hypothetical protein GCM10007881_20230 [Mesorhizobium huakuii]